MQMQLVTRSKLALARNLLKCNSEFLFSADHMLQKLKATIRMMVVILSSRKRER